LDSVSAPAASLHNHRDNLENRRHNHSSHPEHSHLKPYNKPPLRTRKSPEYNHYIHRDKDNMIRISCRRWLSRDTAPCLLDRYMLVYLYRYHPDN